MTSIHRSADCGNSPKNKMVEDVGIALEMGDTKFLSTVLDPGTVWNRPGGTLSTAEDMLEALSRQDKPAALTVLHAISHGKVGTVNGHADRGQGEQRFCHVVEFSSTKYNRIARIESYDG